MITSKLKITEISKLNSDLDKLKKMVEESQNIYETMLDKTTRSIEEIIKNRENRQSSINALQRKTEKKIYSLKKKKYFVVKNNFFQPLLKIIKNNKKKIFQYIIHPIMKLTQ